MTTEKVTNEEMWPWLERIGLTAEQLGQISNFDDIHHFMRCMGEQIRKEHPDRRIQSLGEQELSTLAKMAGDQDWHEDGNAFVWLHHAEVNLAKEAVRVKREKRRVRTADQRHYDAQEDHGEWA